MQEEEEDEDESGEEVRGLEELVVAVSTLDQQLYTPGTGDMMGMYTESKATT